ncbi:MAG: carbon storage regulator [Planctomycetes bacterium]|nr:carbon storage regulator [Planctomycetota bacterium]
MLVLSRKIGEAVVIGGGVVVRVLDAGGGRVRLGVVAPDEVLVLREEVADRLGLTATRDEPKEACRV